MRDWRLATTVVGLVAALCSCQGSGPSAGSSSAEHLEDYIPGLGSDPAQVTADEAAMLALEIETQELIQRCMADEGFEYIPFVPASDGAQSGQFVDPASQLEFREQYGFGIVAGISSPGIADFGSDPNDVVFENLSPAEQSEYSLALHGVPVQLSESMTDEEISQLLDAREATGCGPKAYSDTSRSDSGTSAAATSFLDQFGDPFSRMLLEVRSDPRMVEIEGLWSSCMASLGYDFRGEDDITLFVLRRLEEVGVVADLQVDSAGTSYTVGDVEDDQILRTALADIAQEEIHLAQQSFECEKVHQEAYAAVYDEYEAGFVSEYGGDLEQFRSEQD